jgi:hypothetical protein
MRSNGGAAGVDAETIRAIEQSGVERFLAEIHAALRAGRYRPSPVKRRCIPKANGKQNGLAQTDGNGVLSNASHTEKIIVKPCAGKQYAWFERGY